MRKASYIVTMTADELEEALEAQALRTKLAAAEAENALMRRIAFRYEEDQISDHEAAVIQYMSRRIATMLIHCNPRFGDKFGIKDAGGYGFTCDKSGRMKTFDLKLKFTFDYDTD